MPATLATEGAQASGGAIDNLGNATLVIRRSTASDNLAAGGRGSPAGHARGGAIVNSEPAAFRIERSTITGNAAVSGAGDHQAGQSVAGGIFHQSQLGESSIFATTIASNSASHGSNIYNTGGSLSLEDTIVSNPRTPAGTGGENCAHPSVFPAAVDSLGHNLDSDGSCELKATGDEANKDPRLKDLADNGGPTQTMAIPLSSPALDQGVSGGLTTDQRGEKRPVIVPGVPRRQGGDGSDIGAYEYQPGPGRHSRIRASVKPGHGHVGERTCFKFKAWRPTGGSMKKVQVKFSAKRARTDEDGKAIICKRFKGPGDRRPRLRKRGYERAELNVDVRP